MHATNDEKRLTIVFMVPLMIINEKPNCSRKELNTFPYMFAPSYWSEDIKL